MKKVTPIVTQQPLKIDSAALYIAKKLEFNNFKSYIVGGAVRDLLLNRKPKDYDIVTDAQPNKIKKIFGRNALIIGRRFRLCLVNVKNKQIEVITLRHHQSSDFKNIYANNIKSDYKRRDFTINAIYYNPLKKHIIDYSNGVDDLKERIIKPIIPLSQIFLEDPVRIIRAIKFSVTLNFSLQSNMEEKLKEQVYLINDIPKSRLQAQFEKIMQNSKCYKIIMTLHKYNIFANILEDFKYLEKALVRKNNYKKLFKLLVVNSKLKRELAYVSFAEFFKGIISKNSKFKLKSLGVLIPNFYFEEKPPSKNEKKSKK